MPKYKFVLWILLSLILISDLSAQNENKDFAELKTACESFLKKNYEDAYPYFKKTLSFYPKDPGYNHYTGVCLLNLEKNPTKALRLLQYAAEKDITNEVYFYLGVAYLKNYKFLEALDNFKKFEKKATPRQIHDFDLENYISKAENGNYLVRYARVPTVYSKIYSTEVDFYKKYDTQSYQGKFEKMKIPFVDKKDSLAEKTIVFIPNQTGSEEVLYFSAKNKGRGDYDIFSSVRYNDSLYGEPENLGNVINTPFDENYPFLHSDGVSLYFASKGHYSMGGYDLYKSTWDWKKQQWSEPENLDFPINSPYNEILFVPSPDKKIASFATDRDFDKPGYCVYQIKLNNSKPFIKINNHEAILKYANPEIEIENQGNKQKSISKSAGSDIMKIRDENRLLQKTEYDSLLEMAVNYQFKSDSLKWILDDKRAKLDEKEHSQQNKELANSIVDLESKIYKLQKEADKCYSKIKQIEQLNLAENKTLYEQTDKQKSLIDASEKVMKEKNYIEPVDSGMKKSLLKPLSVFVDSSQLERRAIGLRVQQPSVYNNQNPISINGDMPEGLVYMIQLGAFSSVKEPEVFKGLEPICGMQNKNSSIIKYLAGSFGKLKDAEEKLPVVKKLGFRDAYIVAFHNGKIIPVKDAVNLELSKTELLDSDNYYEAAKMDEVDLSISYVVSVEIAKTDTLFHDKLNKIVPAEKEIVIEEKNGSIVYTVRSITKFGEALKIKKKTEVITNNIIEIQAFYAKIRLPLEQAKKITE